jgi:uncharacterized membrane protein YeaQ/YmgE (transglycosylase-associated protein family)
VIGAIIIGIIAGYLGRALMPGRHEFGFIMTTILGIVGAILGYLLFTAPLGIGDTDTFDLGSLQGAVIGSSSCSSSTTDSPAARRPRRARRDPVALSRDSLGRTRAVVERVRCTRSETRRPPLTLGYRLLLDPVLAERGEVDHQIGGVKDVLSNDRDCSFHVGQATSGTGRN